MTESEAMNKLHAKIVSSNLVEKITEQEMMAFCKAKNALEKQAENKELESHYEKYILKACIILMQGLVEEFAEWYRWMQGDDAIEKLSEEEIFCIRKSYFKIVQMLFLWNTYHSGGTSTRAKCEQLGVDWSEEVMFGWRYEE